MIYVREMYARPLSLEKTREQVQSKLMFFLPDANPSSTYRRAPPEDDVNG